MDTQNDLHNYTELLYKKEEEIKQISILKLKKLESVLRNKEVQIKDMEEQVETLNKELLETTNLSKSQKLTLKDYEDKFL